MSIATLTLTELRQKLSAKEVTPKEVVQGLIDHISSKGEKVNGYLRLDEEAALAQAEQADISLPLGGVPIALKDNINTRGSLCTCASQILSNFKSPYDSTVTAKLREAGAIFLGRTNMDEFAMGSSTEQSSFHPTRNPWDTERIPGGSSGGSASVVAADLAIAALGSDTGGSIRQPAGLCGCVGFKPTYGRVSRYGLVAFASSLDQIGPLTKTVEDTALIMNHISGVDGMDNTTRHVDTEDYTAKLGQSVKGMRVGIPKEYFIDGIDHEVEASIRKAIQWYEDQGAELVDISLPHTSAATAVYYIIATAEASANLARFDGIRYGKRAEVPSDIPEKSSKILEVYRRSREEGFGPEVKRRVILGTFVLSSGYSSKYYDRAQKVRYLLRQDFEKAFEKCDVIATPTSPTAAFRIGEKSEDPLQMYLADIFTIAANLSGVPGISIPCGFTSQKLPVGLQLLGPHFGESTILQAAHAYETDHGWVKERPQL